MIGNTDHSTYKPALTYHPLANDYPMIEGPERNELRQSLRDKGLRVRIVMHEGMILDGRNRYRELLGLQVIDHSTDWRTSPYFRAWGSEESDGEDPEEFVFDLNLTRRHLSESQRAMVAARRATRRRGERTDLKDGSSLGGAVETTSRAEAAERFNVSERSVNSAKAVQDRGAPGLVEAVDQNVLPVSVAEKLLGLPEAEQERLVAEETPAVIRNAAKKAQRNEKEQKLAIKQKALPSKRYGVIYVDPAWRFEPRSRETGLDRAADNHYPTMTTEQIIALDVPSITAPDCAMFMWATAPMLTDALKVMSAWGFTHKSQYIWDKTPWDGDGELAQVEGREGTGFWSRVNHEILLLGTRGSPPCPAPGDNPSSVYREVASAHSAKPEYYAAMIQGFFPNLPKIELNARAPRDGWDVWGNEAEGKEASPEKPAKAKKDTRSKYEIQRDEHEARVIALFDAITADDADHLIRQYAAAIHVYHGAFLAKDADAVGSARDLMDALERKAREFPTLGAAEYERRDGLRRACAAPIGSEPVWGQDGFVLGEADGVRAIVAIGGRQGSIHAVDLDKPFPSSTGFHSTLASPELGQTVEEFAASCIRSSIAYANGKDKALRAAQRGLMMPERAYRLEESDDQGLVPVERGIKLPAAWVIGEVASSDLEPMFSAWMAELRDLGVKKRKWPESRHNYTPVFAIRYVEGVPVAAEPVDDFPARGGYVYRDTNGGDSGWVYVAGGEADRGIVPVDLDEQVDPCPERWPSVKAHGDKPSVTRQHRMETKIVWSIMAGRHVSDGPIVRELVEVGVLSFEGKDLQLTAHGYSVSERLGAMVQAAMEDNGSVRVSDMPDVDSAHTDANLVSSAYIAELQKVAHLHGELHQSTAEAVMRAGYAARIPVAQMADDLGHPMGTIKTWANRLKLTSADRMLENQAAPFTAADGFDQMSAEVPDVNGDAVRAGLKVTLTEDVVAEAYEVRRVYKNGNISISNGSGHQQVIKVGDFVLARESEAQPVEAAE